MKLIFTNDAKPANPHTEGTWSWQLPDNPVAEPPDPDTEGTWSWQLPEDLVAEPADPDTGPAPDRPKGRKCLALALAVVTLLNVAVLTTGALYAVSIDRAINDNLRHKSDLLPADEKAHPGEELS